LNRDVAPIVRQRNGSLAVGGTGEVVDWVVRMARVPPGDFLDVKAAASGLPPVLLDQIADAVAAWHMALPPVLGLRPDMAAIAQGNVGSAIAAGLGEVEVLAWHASMLAGLRARAAWSDARAAAGFVRRCHGDLHLGNLCLWQGKPVLFDALEFDEALATTDVAYDLAFLLMDLEHSLDRAAANRGLNRYVARTGDAGLVGGLPVFLSMRAMIRAHVEAGSGHAGRIAGYLTAAAQYLQPHTPLVIAIGGLPASGKSTLARALAPLLGAAPGALVLRSDEIRKRIFGVAPEAKLPQNAYTPDASREVFGTMLRGVAAASAAGHTVIADATFMDARLREAVQRAAGGACFLGVWLQAPLPVLEARVAARRDDASDADVAVLRRAAKDDPGAGDWLAVDATDADTALATVRTAIAGR
jgi:hypothetical protein